MTGVSIGESVTEQEVFVSKQQTQLTGCARITAWPPASVLIREKGRKELSVKT